MSNKHLINYALSAQDIKKIFNNKIKVILYSDIARCKTIENLLKPYGVTMILYYWKSDPSYFGHWCICFYNKNNNVEFFNSFGGKIDDTLNQIDKDFKEENNLDFKHLTKLLYDYTIKGGLVEYNPKQLQKKIGTSTCGRWCIYRVLRNDLNINQFNKLFPRIGTNDKKITKLTNLLL